MSNFENQQQDPFASGQQVIYVQQQPEKKSGGCLAWMIKASGYLLAWFIGFAMGISADNDRDKTNPQPACVLPAHAPESNAGADMMGDENVLDKDWFTEERLLQYNGILAAELMADYEKNEVAADKRFKGKTLLVRGVVDEIGVNLFDYPYVQLETGKPLHFVMCSFSKADKAALENLKPGDRVSIRGKCGGGCLLSVTLSNCELK